MWIAVAILAIGAAAALGGIWQLGSILTRPVSTEPTPAMPPARDVSIRAGDGVLLAATYRPGPSTSAPGVLLLHGNGGSRGSVAETARWLAGLGYATLWIDFRGHGQSTPRPRSFGLYEARDATAAFAWLKNAQGGGRVGVVGISLGGAASLLGDDGPLPADALVLQAVYPDIRHAIRNRVAAQLPPVAVALLEPLLSFQSRLRFGVWPSRLSPIRALAHYPGPVLIMGGNEDPYTPPAETRAMFAAAPGPKALWLAPGSDHAALAGIATPDYRRTVAAFLARYIGANPRAVAADPPKITL